MISRFRKSPNLTGRPSPVKYNYPTVPKNDLFKNRYTIKNIQGNISDSLMRTCIQIGKLFGLNI